MVSKNISLERRANLTLSLDVDQYTYKFGSHEITMRLHRIYDGPSSINKQE